MIHLLAEKIIIIVIKSYTVNILMDAFQTGNWPQIIMAEACAGEDFVNIDKEWAEGTLEEASKYVAEIVEKFSDFGRAYGAPSESVCNEGKHYI